MKKKTFKKAGAAVLTMAMVLSMGALAATSVGAEPDTATFDVTINNGNQFGYKYSKIASLDEDGISYTVETAWQSYIGVDGNNYLRLKDGDGLGKKLSDITAATSMQKLATDLATYNVAGIAVGDTDVVTLTPGYYLFSSSQTNVQPILVEITGQQTLNAKANDVTITKTITAIEDNTTTEAAANLIKKDGKVGLVSDGAKVTFTLSTSIPRYDATNLAGANITDFVVTDIPEDTLKNLTVTKVEVAGLAVVAGEGTYSVDDAENEKLKADGTKMYFTEDQEEEGQEKKDSAGAGKKITFKDAYVLANGGKNVVITLTADVEDPDVNLDENSNTATVEYNNNYWTGGSKFKTPENPKDDDDKIPDPSKEPDDPNDYDQDTVAVYATLLTVDKLDQDGASLAGAEFELYKGNSATGEPIATLGGRDEEMSEFLFSGLNVGTYTLHESVTPTDEYKAAADITFTITSTTEGVYSFTGLTNNTAYPGGVIDVTNIKGQSLPATGGIGTIIFTVGGAAIVLLAGAMFVFYMKKRKAED